jgi:tetratricopeptide (TPR) repeat protein
VALFLGTLLVFCRAIGNDFVGYDDPDYVTKNSHVQDGLGWGGVQWALTSGAASNWHPLTWVSHMTDWTLFGDDPRGHHAVSLLWHALNAVLVFLLLRRLTGGFWSCAFCAALFAWHPLRVESVAWVAERKDVLSGFFGLAALWAYASYARALPQSRALARRYYWLCFAAFALGLMSKPMLVTLPGVFLLLDYWPLSRIFAAPSGSGTSEDPACIWLEKIPFVALSATSSVVTYLVQRNGGAVSQALGLDVRLETAIVAVPRYLGKLLYPFDLAVLYPHPGSWSLAAVMGSALFVGAVTFIGWTQRRSRPWIVVGWLWFLGMLLPVSGIVQVGIQSMGDRYTYLPMLGIQIAAIWSVKGLMNSRSAREMGAIAAMAILAGLAVRTWDQIGLWKDTFTLFDHALAVTDANYMAYNNRGVFLEDQGRYREAEADFRRALGIEPDFDDANANLGHLLDKQGNPTEGLAFIRRAVTANPGLVVAHVDLGEALSDLGRLDEAIGEYKWVLARDPGNEEALDDYGVALAMKGRPAEAEESILAALRLKPRDAIARSNLGNVHSMMGRLDAAIADYRRSLELKPDAAETHYNLANALLQTGHFAEAGGEFESALKLRPEDPDAHARLGLALAQLGRRQEAIVQLETAIRQRPDFSQARAWLQAVLAIPATAGK